MTEYRKLICFIVNVMSDMNAMLFKSIQAILVFICFSASGINQNFLQANHIFKGKITV